jgi:hypothetical protein
VVFGSSGYHFLWGVTIMAENKSPVGLLGCHHRCYWQHRQDTGFGFSAFARI